MNFLLLAESNEAGCLLSRRQKAGKRKGKNTRYATHVVDLEVLLFLLSPCQLIFCKGKILAWEKILMKRDNFTFQVLINFTLNEYGQGKTTKKKKWKKKLGDYEANNLSLYAFVVQIAPSIQYTRFL